MTSDQHYHEDGRTPFPDDDGRLSDLFELACRHAPQAAGAVPPPEPHAELAAVQRLLDMVDAAWETVPSELDHARALFLQKLAAKQPDHPWVRSSTVETLGELYRISRDELPALPDESSERLARDATSVGDLLDTGVRSKLLGLALRSASVPQRAMGDLVLGLNRMLSALAPLSRGPQRQFVFTRRQRGKRGDQ